MYEFSVKINAFKIGGDGLIFWHVSRSFKNQLKMLFFLVKPCKAKKIDFELEIVTFEKVQKFLLGIYGG